jgi:hypothetical protein
MGEADRLAEAVAVYFVALEAGDVPAVMEAFDAMRSALALYESVSARKAS